MANDNFSLMGSPMFRMGMGILEGATPQATPPNAIRNMLGGLQGASDYRNTEVNRMLDRQRYKMQLEQQKREQEKWEFERKQLERQQKVMDQWPPNQSTIGGSQQPITPPGVAQQPIAPPGVAQQSIAPPGVAGLPQIGAGQLPTQGQGQLPTQGQVSSDAQKQALKDNYQQYLTSLQMKKQMAAAKGDFAGVAEASKEELAVQKAVQDLDVRGLEPDRYKHAGFVTSKKPGGRSLGMMYDTYAGQYVVNTPEGKVPFNEAEFGHTFTASNNDPTNSMISAENFNALQNDYYDGAYALGQVNDLYRMIELQDDAGIGRTRDNIVAKIRGAYGADLTNAQMATLLAEGETGKLVGSMRIELFGGGPLTDTEREFAMDLIKGNWTSNKEVMKQRLMRIYKAKENKVKRYGSQLGLQHSLRGNTTWSPESFSNQAASKQVDFLNLADELDQMTR
jgi:hypothetical protein